MPNASTRRGRSRRSHFDTDADRLKRVPGQSLDRSAGDSFEQGQGQFHRPVRVLRLRGVGDQERERARVFSGESLDVVQQRWCRSGVVGNDQTRRPTNDSIPSPLDEPEPTLRLPPAPRQCRSEAIPLRASIWRQLLVIALSSNRA